MRINTIPTVAPELMPAFRADLWRFLGLAACLRCHPTFSKWPAVMSVYALRTKSNARKVAAERPHSLPGCVWSRLPTALRDSFLLSFAPPSSPPPAQGSGGASGEVDFFLFPASHLV
jgi:hypothetical protein